MLADVDSLLPATVFGEIDANVTVCNVGDAKLVAGCKDIQARSFSCLWYCNWVGNGRAEGKRLAPGEKPLATSACAARRQSISVKAENMISGVVRSL